MKSSVRFQMKSSAGSNVAGAQEPAGRTKVPDASSGALKGKSMTQEQIQSAIETAKRVASSAENGIGTRLCREFAHVVFDVYRRLQEAEKERDGFRHIEGQLEDERDEARAELTEARINAKCPCCKDGVALALSGQEREPCHECKGTALVAIAYETCRVHYKLQSEALTDARAAICKCSENTAVALRGRDEARKEIESVTEHARAMENSSDSYRERLDEASRQLDIARKDMRDVAAETKRVVRCGCLGCLTDDCDHWGVDCHLKDYTLCHIGRTVDNQITPTETQAP